MTSFPSFPPSSEVVLRVAGVAFAVILSACGKQPPTAASLQLSCEAQWQALSRTDTPWRQMTDGALAAKILEAGGRVFIGFKDPGATAGVDERGRVLASAASIAEAKTQLRALGIAIIFEVVDMPTVVARMPAELVAQLRRNPLIEYIEPIFPGTYNQVLPTCGATG